MTKQSLTSPWKVAAALSVALLVTPGAAMAKDIVVNDDLAGRGPTGANCAAPSHSTIQAAVDAASGGDRVLVCEGTYSAPAGQPAARLEKPIQVTASLAKQEVGGDLVDAYAGAMINDPDGGFVVNADGVSITGFKIRTSTDASGSGGWTGIALVRGSRLRASQNSFEGSGIGIDLGDVGNADAVVTTNRFGSAEPAVRGGWVSGPVISYNTGGTISFRGSLENPARNVYLRGNPQMRVELTDTRSVIIDQSDSQPGVWYPLTQLVLDGGNHGVTVDHARFASGNFLDQEVPLPPVLVTRAEGTDANSGLKITNSDIGAGANGFAVRVDSEAYEGPLDVSHSRFLGNQFGAFSIGSGPITVSAENNWWGCNGGAGQPGCDVVGDVPASSVDVEPHLLFTLTVGPQPFVFDSLIGGYTVDVFHNSAGEVFDSGFSGPLVPVQNPGDAHYSDRPVPLANGFLRFYLGNNMKPGGGTISAKLDSEVQTGTIVFPDWDKVLGECDSTTDYYNGTLDNDKFRGTGADDGASGKGGNDRLVGGGGDDCLDGGDGADMVSGGKGDDLVIGGKGHNVVKAGDGKDILDLRDGRRDRVNCGPGKDIVFTDKKDVPKNCEKVK